MKTNLFSLSLAVTMMIGLGSLTQAFADLNQGHTYIIRGGGNNDLYVHCDVHKWHCVGTQNENQATRFIALQASGTGNSNVGRAMATGGFNVSGTIGENRTRNWQMQVQGTSLCLDVWDQTWDLNLYRCAPNVSKNQGFYMRENVSNTAGGSRVSSTEIGSTYHGVLWWTGTGKQLEMVGTCGPFAWQCSNWFFQRR